MSPTLEDLQAAFEGLLAQDVAGVGPTAIDGAGAPAAPAPSPIQRVDPKTRGFHLDVTVAPARVVAAAEILSARGFAMDTVTGVDWLAASQMEVVYDFMHFLSPIHVVIRTRVPREQPELPTISGVFPGANWHERETHEFFGIKFLGHPNLTPLLLPEDADFHPLRKDYAGAA